MTIVTHFYRPKRARKKKLRSTEYPGAGPARGIAAWPAASARHTGVAAIYFIPSVRGRPAGAADPDDAGGIGLPWHIEHVGRAEAVVCSVTAAGGADARRTAWRGEDVGHYGCSIIGSFRLVLPYYAGAALS